MCSCLLGRTPEECMIFCICTPLIVFVLIVCLQFAVAAGDKATTARERSLEKVGAPILQKLCKKYDNLAEVDKLASVSKKVESVKLVMQQNVDLALQNCVKLESIEKAAEELQQQAGVFKRNANDLKKKMWWKNIKVSCVSIGSHSKYLIVNTIIYCFYIR